MIPASTEQSESVLAYSKLDLPFGEETLQTRALGIGSDLVDEVLELLERLRLSEVDQRASEWASLGVAIFGSVIWHERLHFHDLIQDVVERAVCRTGKWPERRVCEALEERESELSSKTAAGAAERFTRSLAKLQVFEDRTVKATDNLCLELCSRLLQCI